MSLVFYLFNVAFFLFFIIFVYPAAAAAAVRRARYGTIYNSGYVVRHNNSLSKLAPTTAVCVCVYYYFYALSR